MIIYTCDSTDSAGGLCRQKLFNKWYVELSDIVERYDLEVNIEIEHGIESTYGGVVARKDFPYPDVLNAHLIEQASGIMLQKFGH